MLRWIAIVAALSMAAGVPDAQAQSPRDLDALSARVEQLTSAARYAEAIPVATQALALAERRHGARGLATVSHLNRLANLYYQLSRYAEAAPLYRRALDIREKTLGPAHADVARSLGDLANTYYYWDGQAGQAVALYERVLGIRDAALGSRHATTAQAAQDLGDALYKVRRYGDAEAAYRRALAAREAALGPDHRLTARSIQDLADTIAARGRHSDAEALSRRALAIREQVLEPSDRAIAYSLNQLAWSIEEQGRAQEAQPLLRRALAISEQAFGPEHPTTAFRLNRLAESLVRTSAFDEADRLFQRVLALRTKLLGAGHVDVARTLASMGVLRFWQGKPAEGEDLIRRGLAIREQVEGAAHPEVARALRYLGAAAHWRGNTREAERHYKRALAIREAALGRDHPDVAESLNDLAGLIGADDLELVRNLYARAHAIFEARLGPESPWAGASLSGLAWVFYSQEKYGEAEPLYRRALAIYEKSYGAGHPFVASPLISLANVHYWQNRLDAAEPLYRRAVALYERALGPNHFQVADPLYHLGSIQSARRQYADAETSWRRALDIYEQAFGPSHPYVTDTLARLGAISFAQERWSEAAAHMERSADVLVRRARIGTATLGASPAASRKSEENSARTRLERLIKARFRMALASPDAAARLHGENFLTAQAALGADAAAAILQMAARSVKGEGDLARLVRERQDLLVEWQAADKARIAGFAQSPERRAEAPGKAAADRLSAIEARLAGIDRELALKFPEYAALVSPSPLQVREVRALLRDDEALVLLLPTASWMGSGTETFAWVVTATDARFGRVQAGGGPIGGRDGLVLHQHASFGRVQAGGGPIGGRDGLVLHQHASFGRVQAGGGPIDQAVAFLRCGLDDAAWSATACAAMTGKSYSEAERRAGKPPPFDLDVLRAAHRIYDGFLRPFEDIIAGKHLLVVPAGALAGLPLHVLVTEPPASADHRAAAWLGRKHAVTVLPSVSALKALRAVAQPSAATLPMIGFGNPLLDGPDSSYAALAAEARRTETCAQRSGQRLAAASRGRVMTLEPPALSHGLVDVALLRRQLPLPETADELCTVAGFVGADAADVRLGGNATEAELKRLSAGGRLTRYRTVHFATHGALAGEISGTSEPGLILTPPLHATEEDDGYLSASEIVGLKLDADWVILSACNTAGSTGDRGAEAFSGLARAFFYAGARAMLVSHWAVDSNAAVKLVSSISDAMAKDARVGRAEALRRAMLALIDNGPADEAHPAFWAPFVVVGEGAGRR